MQNHLVSNTILILLGLVLGLILTFISPILVLIVVIGFVAFSLVFTNIDLGITIVALAGVLPSLARAVGPVIVPLVDVVMIVIFIPWVLKTLLYRDKIKWPSLNSASIVLLIAMIISAINAVRLDMSIKEIAQYCVFAFLYSTVLFNNINNTKIINRMMNILTTGTAILGGYAFMKFVQQGRAGLYILGLHKNALGGLLVLPLPFLYMRFITTKKPIWFFLMLINGLGLMASLSRGAWVGGIVGTFLVALLFGKKELKRYVLVVIIAALAFFVLVPKGAKEMATSSRTLDEREVYWSIAIEGFLAKPITGWGYGNFLIVSRRYIGDRPIWLVSEDPHNVYLRFATEMGVVGLLAFSFFIFFVFYRLISNVRKNIHIEKKVLVIGLTGSLIAYFVHGFFDVFWVRGTGSLFWIFINLAFILIEKESLKINSMSCVNEKELAQSLR